MNTETSTLPIHIGIIMDGNGRWAKLRNLPRTKGHREGLDVAKQIVKAASDLGIKFVTLYTFSTENWKRTQEEVGYLMTLIKKHLSSEFNFYKENKIRIVVDDNKTTPVYLYSKEGKYIEHHNDIFKNMRIL